MKMNVLKLVVGIVSVIVIGDALSGGTLFGLLNFAQFSPTQKQGELKDFSNEDGYVEIKPPVDKKTFTTGSQESLDVNVSLREKQIVGFNIPVEYDPYKFEFVGVENADSRFNMYTRRENTDHVILVGVQQVTNTDKIVLYKQTVARLIFKVVGGGVSHMDIKERTPKGYQLKLVNQKNDALLPSFGELQVMSK